ncbi:MAG: hypothetical protein IPP19_02960 [Verrucomicrobia bacterium]|nr:hypothetical protein [Verrucomicrobiota bacterium]
MPTWLPGIGGTQQWAFDDLVSMFNGTGEISSLLGVIGLPFLVNWSERNRLRLDLP